VKDNIHEIHNLTKLRVKGYPALLAASLEVITAADPATVRMMSVMFFDLIVASEGNRPLQQTAVNLLNNVTLLSDPSDASFSSLLHHSLFAMSYVDPESKREDSLGKTFTEGVRELSKSSAEGADKASSLVLALLDPAKLELTLHDQQVRKPSGKAMEIVRNVAAEILHDFRPEKYPSSRQLTAFSNAYGQRNYIPL
jgi:hypothetical protein